MGSFLKWFTLIMPLLMPATQAVEGIVTEAKAGATKKQLAMDSLGVASAVAATVTPTNAAAVKAATSLVSTAIDSIVALQNAIHGKVPTPATPPQAASQ
jgi:seryl-tRNA(Sec) selenium transferase